MYLDRCVYVVSVLRLTLIFATSTLDPRLLIPFRVLQNNPLPILGMFIQCFGWTIYGIVIFDHYVFICNFFGVVMGLDMTLVCLRIGTNDQKELISRVMVGSISFISVVMYATLPIGAPLNHEAQLIWGFVCVTFNMFMFSAPLSTMKMVIQTSDASSISFPTCVAQMGCSTFWALYGLIAGDAAIYTPNLFGVATAIAQAGLLAW